MRRTFSGILGMALVIACLCGVAAFAQKHRLTVEIPFKFSAAGEEFSPGRYEITPDPQGASRLRIRSLPNGETKLVSYMTRLSVRTSDQPQLVFDKEGNLSYLTEIYLPGTDGYYLKGAPGDHQHTTVQGSGQ